MDANETEIYYAVLITGVLLGGIILYFAFAVIRYQRRRLDKQRGYFLTEIDLLEKDRTRIAHDLHDELGPLLAVTQFHIRSLAGVAADASRHLEDADRNIQQVLERLSGIAAGLTPRSLHMKGLHFALQDFTEQLKHTGRLPVEFSYEVVSRLPSDIGIHIYRIVQELLHNALKHAEAKNIRVRITERRKVVCISYSDDGRGFEIESAENKSEGLGLRSLRSRTAMVNGKMYCYAAPGKGAEYLFEIPINLNNESAD